MKYLEKEENKGLLFTIRQVFTGKIWDRKAGEKYRENR